MMAAEPFTAADLVWAQGILGYGAEQLLWDALCEAGCFHPGDDGLTNSCALSAFMCFLVEPVAPTKQSGLVWTLPPQFISVPGLSGDSYAEALKDIVESALSSLTIVSPYLEPKGLGRLEEATVSALFRGVNTVLITHEAADLGSMSSAGLKPLRAAAAGLAGKLSVYTTSTKGVLMHLKAIVADGARGLVGSANLTGKGLSGNVEAGVHIGQHESEEIQWVGQQLIAAGLAEHVFST